MFVVHVFYVETCIILKIANLEISCNFCERLEFVLFFYLIEFFLITTYVFRCVAVNELFYKIRFFNITSWCTYLLQILFWKILINRNLLHPFFIEHSMNFDLRAIVGLISFELYFWGPGQSILTLKVSIVGLIEFPKNTFWSQFFSFNWITPSILNLIYDLIMILFDISYLLTASIILVVWIGFGYCYLKINWTIFDVFCTFWLQLFLFKWYQLCKLSLLFFLYHFRED